MYTFYLLNFIRTILCGGNPDFDTYGRDGTEITLKKGTEMECQLSFTKCAQREHTENNVFIFNFNGLSIRIRCEMQWFVLPKQNVNNGKGDVQFDTPLDVDLVDISLENSEKYDAADDSSPRVMCGVRVETDTLWLDGNDVANTEEVENAVGSVYLLDFKTNNVEFLFQNGLYEIKDALLNKKLYGFVNELKTKNVKLRDPVNVLELNFTPFHKNIKNMMFVDWKQFEPEIQKHADADVKFEEQNIKFTTTGDKNAVKRSLTAAEKQKKKDEEATRKKAEIAAAEALEKQKEKEEEGKKKQKQKDEEDKKTPAESEGMSSTTKTLIIVLCVVLPLLALGSGLAYYFLVFKKRQTKSEEVEKV